MKQAENFRSESKALYGLLNQIEEARFSEPTLFKDWTTNCVLRHLHYWNFMAELQLTDEPKLKNQLRSLYHHKGSLREFEAAALENMSGSLLLETWIAHADLVSNLFGQADPKARLKWAGPDMSARSSITARLMETWAHGQEIYDHFGKVRTNQDYIQDIVVLGINTFSWTYKVRKEPVPETMPYLELTAPSGDVWKFGEAGPAGSITGLAEEFCQVVTQTRNILDTSLIVRGNIAKDWMSKAQCFAGRPTPPPPAGSRYRASIN